MLGKDIYKAFHRIHTNYNSDPNVNVELEVRFSVYHQKSGIDQVTYDRLLQELQTGKLRATVVSNNRSQITDTITTVRKADGSTVRLRKSSIAIPSPGISELKWTAKQELYSEINKEYGIKYAISTETNLDKTGALTMGFDENNSNVRTKFRNSFLVTAPGTAAPRGFATIDLTKVVFYNRRTGEEDKRYELEVELVSPELIKEYQELVHEVLRLLLNTELVYTKSEYQDTIEFFNTYSKPPKYSWDKFYPQSETSDIINGIHNYRIGNRKITSIFTPKPRTLKFQDLVWGGLAGNKTVAYDVSFKADGVRKQLLTNKFGVWLISAPYNLNLVMRYTSKFRLDGLRGYILDGELIPSNYDGVKYQYWAFDCVCRTDTDGKPDNAVQNLSHRGKIERGSNPDTDNKLSGIYDVGSRMKYAQLLADNINSQLSSTNSTEILAVNTKRIRAIASVDDFYIIMRQMIAQMNIPDGTAFPTDGLIFTPSISYYVPTGSLDGRKKLKKSRNLSNYPDICKWKPEGLRTIDFKLPVNFTRGEAPEELLVSRNTGRWGWKDVPFTGDARNKFDGKISQVGLELASPGSIYEFKFIPDDSGGIFEATRARTDKPFPNRERVAIDVWRDIHDPITADTMMGYTTRLLRKYNNRIKRQLFDSVSRDSTLLDIGSGMGGDISKWKKFKKVLAVEPQAESIIEFNRRLETFGSSDKKRIHILRAGGQDTEVIAAKAREIFTNGKVDVVSMMLSLSFFWQNETVLQSLVDTIKTVLKPGGKIIYLTIDGDAVTQTFRPAFGVHRVIDAIRMGSPDLQTGQIDIKYEPQGDRGFNLELGGTSLQMADIESGELFIKMQGAKTLPGEDQPAQREWLVHLDDLYLRLPVTSRSNYIADQEIFLNPREQILTRLYSYGFMNLGTEKVTLPIQSISIEPIVPITVKMISGPTSPRPPSLPQVYTAVPQQARTVTRAPTLIPMVPPSEPIAVPVITKVSAPKSPVKVVPVASAPVLAEPPATAPVKVVPVASGPVLAEPPAPAPVKVVPVASGPVLAEPSVKVVPVLAKPTVPAPVKVVPVASAPVLAEPSVKVVPVLAKPPAPAPVVPAPVLAKPTVPAPVKVVPVASAPVLAKSSIKLVSAPVVSDQLPTVEQINMMNEYQLNNIITKMGILKDVNRLIWNKLVQFGINQYPESMIMDMTKTQELTVPLGMKQEIRQFVISKLLVRQKLPDPSQLTTSPAVEGRSVLPPPPTFEGPVLKGRSAPPIEPIPIEPSPVQSAMSIISPLPLESGSGDILSPPPPIATPGEATRLRPAPMAVGLSIGGAPPVIGQTGLVPIMPTVQSTDTPMKQVVPISVTITRSKSGIIAKGDDTYANIRTDIFKTNMIRLACIYGKSSVFHALAKCLLPEYAHDPDYDKRLVLANNLRAQIGYLWTSDANYYLSSGGGQWARNAKISRDPVTRNLVTSRTAVPTVDIDEYGKRINYSQKGLMNLFNSDRIVDHRFYEDIANGLGIKIILVTVIGNLSTDDIRFKHEYPSNVQQNLSSGRVVVLFQPDSSITEIVGIKTPSGQLQIVFKDSDALINAIRAKF